MFSKKDSKKSKDILLVIDLVLLAVALVVGGWWVYLSVTTGQIDLDGYEQTMQQLDQQEAELVQQIDARGKQLRENDPEFAQDCAAAQERIAAAQLTLQEARTRKDTAQQKIDDLKDPERMKEMIAELRTEYGQTVRQLEDMILAGETEYRICYLTLDDGPTYHTQKFLDKLAELDALVTFFTIGGGIPEHNWHIRDEYLRQEALGGHSIANHTYSHAYYGPLYKSVDSFMEQVYKQDELVYGITGIHTDIVRFPCGSYYCTYRGGTINALTEAGFGWIDWSGNAYDAGDNNYSSEQTAGTVIWQARQELISVVLMHDWNVNTLGALEKIVTTLRAENYLFLPLFKESCTIGNTSPKWG